MSKFLKFTFLIHFLVSVVFGLLLLIIPGSFLGLFKWSPVDPLLSRVFGAALVGLAWGSWRGWRAQEWSRVAYLVEVEAVFTVLACVGLLRHLLVAYYPFVVWFVFGVMLLFAIAWVVALLQHRK